jgi:hypothetical protein
MSLCIIDENGCRQATEREKEEFKNAESLMGFIYKSISEGYKIAIDKEIVGYTDILHQINEIMCSLYEKTAKVPKYLIIGREKYEQLHQQLHTFYSSFSNYSPTKGVLHTQFGDLHIILVESDILEVVYELRDQVMIGSI